MVRAVFAFCSVVGLVAAEDGRCCYPGVRVEPESKFKEVYPIKPRQQWNINGGFCGSLSLQVMLMGHGAWVSEDLVRKANIGAECAATERAQTVARSDLKTTPRRPRASACATTSG